jgi:hypothetical protein
VFFTDSASLQGLHGPGDFAWRVGLSRQAQDEAHAYGCAVIEFDVPALHTVIHPLPYPGTQQGLTVNGAREWMVPNLNIPLDHTMIVKYIDIGRSGPRCLDIPL